MASLDMVDITQLFVDAASEMKDGEIIMMANYSLNDAMSAFEIGEPRLDSGLPSTSIDGQPSEPVPFDPSEPMLPGELCWLIDKAFAYEMAFHKGHFLPHTIYVLQHVHYLEHLNPDLLPPSYFTFGRYDPQKPVELIVLVLWAFMQGLLKCTDFTWREFNKGAVFDQEDWQSDKCEVSLLEGTPPAYVFARLDQAINWIIASGQVPDPWAQALSARIALRKSLLELLTGNIYKNSILVHQWIASARAHLRTIQQITIREPSPDSPARRAIDSSTARQLSTFTPFVDVEPMSPEDTWRMINSLLDGWEEAFRLSQAHSFTTWTIAGTLRLHRAQLSTDPPYRRSLMQSTFYDNVFVLNTHSFQWLTERLFFETLGVSWTDLRRQLKPSSQSSESTPDELTLSASRVERSCSQLLTSHVRAMYLNPPRRRRHYMKSVMGWQNMIDALDDVLRCIDLSAIQPRSPILAISHVAIYWRLRTILFDIVLAGFPLELYSQQEKCFAYWYALDLMERLTEALDCLIKVAADGTAVKRELEFQRTFLQALHSMTLPVHILMAATSVFPISDVDSAKNAFKRRYKWAFRVEYNDLDSPPIGQPQFWSWVTYLDHLNGNAQVSQVDIRQKFTEAKDILLQLVNTGRLGGWAEQWTGERVKFLTSLAETADSLSKAPIPEPGQKLDMSKWFWGTQTTSGCPRDDGSWFPTLLD